MFESVLIPETWTGKKGRSRIQGSRDESCETDYRKEKEIKSEMMLELYQC